MKINVTKSDIEDNREAREEDPQSCMVWQALARQLDIPDGVLLQVFGDNVSITSDDYAQQIEIDLPSDVMDKIGTWDDGGHVEPFDFNFNLPADWRQQIEKAAQA